MSHAHSTVPPPDAACRVTVVIPARDEATSIAHTLAALVAQRDVDGQRLAHGVFDIIVHANNCSDDTAAVVRRVAAQTPHIRIFVVERTVRAAHAHIGTARKFVLDLAAARFLAAGKPRGIIASIDSDTIADERWIGWIVCEMHRHDAVAGHVTIAEADQDRLLAPVRLLYARELAYRRVLAEVESLFDPLPEDPNPRHTSFVGASFAVTASCYVAAGGLPPLRRLEDLAFSRSLRRIDARIRHSSHVRATTSARIAARVEGGFGTFIAALHDCARSGEPFTVEHPSRTLENIQTRAAVRRIWNGSEHPDDIRQISAIFNLSPEHWLPTIDTTLPLGTVYERIVQRAETLRLDYPPARIETAIDALRTTAAGVRSRIVSRNDDELAIRYTG